MTDGTLSEPSASPPVHPNRSTFGRYVLLRKLASGGMGEIFLAKQRGPSGFEKLIVIKRILSHHLDKKDYLDMFFSEAKLVARLNHPNIIQIHEMGEIDGDHYIAMEYVRGKSLRDIIDELRAEGRRMPMAHVVDLGIKLCEGLGYAHQARDLRGRPMNIVHRDINPHNILISYSGDLKLIDFGIAKSEMTSVHTATGTIKGKFVYMSPEQSAAEPLDRRSDIFSLGIVLYEMLALENPFVRQNVVLSLEAIQRQSVPPPSLRCPEASALDHVLLAALEKAPEKRFQTAVEMRDALRALVRRGAIPPSDVPLSAFLHELFSGEIAEEDRLLAEADAAASELPLPPTTPGFGFELETMTVAEPTQRSTSSFLDDEPTIAGDPEDLAQRSLEMSQPTTGSRFLSSSWSSTTLEQGPRSGRILALDGEPEVRPSAIAAAGVVEARSDRLSASALPSWPATPTDGTPRNARPAHRAARSRGSRVARAAVYALVFVATTVAGFVATRSLIRKRGDAALLAPLDKDAAYSELPGPIERSWTGREARAGEEVEGEGPAVSPPSPLEAAKRTPSPETLPPPRDDAARDGRPMNEELAPKPEQEPETRPRATRPTRRRYAPAAFRRPTAQKPPVDRQGGPPTQATTTNASPPAGAAPPSGPRGRETREPAPTVRGMLRVSTSMPMAVVANGRAVSEGSAVRLRTPSGRVTLSGGSDVDYTVDLVYSIEAGGLSVHIASAPWAVVRHDGRSLGRTPQGPVPAARRHRFALLRPGQGTPLEVELRWRPR